MGIAGDMLCRKQIHRCRLLTPQPPGSLSGMTTKSKMIIQGSGLPIQKNRCEILSCGKEQHTRHGMKICQ
ncbi:hypothetical protein AD930_15470 [Acetobacter malorum]|nr:hypothetical protein AD930_15470 [Acetobacter malorum]